jgi:hypothetical protein
MLQKVTVNPLQLMQDMGDDYQASPNYRLMNRRHRPYFHGWWIEEMLTSPKIQEALKFLKGPIVTKAKFEIITDNSEVKEMTQKLIDRFFLLAAESVLSALEYGYSVHEFIYEPEPGAPYQLNLAEVNYFKSYDTKPCVDKVSKKFDGFWVPQIKQYIRRPKAFHFVYNKKFDKILGRSILHSAFLPWIEEWAVGGMRDIVKLWYAKMCYNSGVLYHPPGSTTLPDGTEIENAQLAQQMAQKAATGHIMTIQIEHGDSMEVGGNGGVRTKWHYESGDVKAVPPGLLEHLKNVKDEQLEAMGIPPEIIQPEGGGMGGTGRSIPVDLYYTTLQQILNSLTYTMFKSYILPLLQYNLDTTLDKLPPVDVRAFELGQETFIDEDGNMVQANEASKDVVDENKAEEARKVQNDPKVTKTRDANKQKAEFGSRGKSTKTA